MWSIAGPFPQSERHRWVHPHSSARDIFQVHRILSKGMKSQSAEAPSDPEIGQGVRIYSTVLQGAGGTQIQALMRHGGDRCVCAALYTAPPYDLHVPGMDVARLSLNLTSPPPASPAASTVTVRADSKRTATPCSWPLQERKCVGAKRRRAGT